MHWNPSGTEPPATVLQSPAHQCYWSHYVLNVNNECSDDVNNTHMMNVKTRTQFQEVLCKNPNKALKLQYIFDNFRLAELSEPSLTSHGDNMVEQS